MPTASRRCPPSATCCVAASNTIITDRPINPNVALLPMPASPTTTTTTTATSISSRPIPQLAPTETTSSSITIPTSSPVVEHVPTTSSTSSTRSCPHLRGLNALIIFALIVVISVGCAALVTDWRKDEVKQLRSWLIVYLLLLIVRVCGRTAVDIFPRDRWLIAGRIFTVFIWIFTVISFVWFIIGVVWLSQVHKVRPFLWYVVCILIGMELCIAGSWILLGLLVFLFALQPVLTNRNKTPAATSEDLEKLPTYKYVADRNNTGESAPVCSICLCEYQPDEVLRELPCAVGAHTFHASCVDEWLMQKLSCPICRDNPLQKNDKQDEDEESESQRDVTAV